VPPLASNAQAMRAILLASATATTLNGLRARSSVSHGYFSGCSRARFKTAWAPTTRMRLRYWSPCFEIGPSLCLPPVEPSRGTNPIQAAKSRPDLKIFGSGTVAANRGGADNPNARDGLEPLARLVRAMLNNDPLLDRSNHRLQRLNPRCQHDQARVSID